MVARDHVHDHIAEFERRFLAKAKKAGIPLYTGLLFVDPGEQVQRYVCGLSADPPGSCLHEYGAAIDIYPAHLGPDCPEECWQILGHMGGEICRQYGLKVQWGGASNPQHWAATGWSPRR